MSFLSRVSSSSPSAAVAFASCDALRGEASRDAEGDAVVDDNADEDGSGAADLGLASAESADVDVGFAGAEAGAAGKGWKFILLALCLRGGVIVKLPLLEEGVEVVAKTVDCCVTLLMWCRGR